MGERLLIISVIILQSSIFIVSSFDYLQLVEQWPPTTCNSLKNNTCLRPSSNNFTIHGLWPGFFNAEAPSFCSKTPFNLSKIKALEPQLNQHWPNLIIPTNNSDFWKYEWRKHGTSSESTFDLPAYFNHTLKLKDQLNLDKVLQDAKITPGKTYPALSIFNVIKNKTQVDPLLRCKSKNKTSQLWEVAVCYDNKGKQYIDCPPPFTKPKAICKDKILFPTS